METLIKRYEAGSLKEIMERATEAQTFDQALFTLYQTTVLISYEEATGNADSASDVRLQSNLGWQSLRAQGSSRTTLTPEMVEKPVEKESAGTPPVTGRSMSWTSGARP